MVQSFEAPLEKTSSQDIQQANFTPARVLSDAELLRDGAEIVDGKLWATGAQILNIALRYSQEEVMDRLGIYTPISLYSPAAALVHRPIEHITDETERRAAFFASVQSLVGQYQSVIDELVPGPNPEDLNWVGKLKSKRGFGPTEFNRPLERVIARYRLHGTYQPGQDANQPLSVNMAVENVGESKDNRIKGGVTLSLNYEAGRLRRLAVNVEQYYEYGRADFRELAAGRSGEALENLAVKNGMMTYNRCAGEFVIALGQDETSIQTRSGVSGYYHTPVKYLYRADRNHLTLTGADPSKYPPEMSLDNFFGLLDDALALLPTLHS